MPAGTGPPVRPRVALLVQLQPDGTDAAAPPGAPRRPPGPRGVLGRDDAEVPDTRTRRTRRRRCLSTSRQAPAAGSPNRARPARRRSSRTPPGARPRPSAGTQSSSAERPRPRSTRSPRRRGVVRPECRRVLVDAVELRDSRWTPLCPGRRTATSRAALTKSDHSATCANSCLNSSMLARVGHMYDRYARTFASFCHSSPASCRRASLAVHDSSWQIGSVNCSLNA